MGPVAVREGLRETGESERGISNATMAIIGVF
jgi:hypothetical protein